MSATATQIKYDPLLYKFIRSCLNRAYAMIDDSQLSAEERYSLETILQRVRSVEESWKSVEDLLNFLKTEFLSIYEDGLKRLPKELVRDLFVKTIELCLELPEVSSKDNVKRVFQEVKEILLKKYEEMKKGESKEGKSGQ
ncbi:MAG: hypothetical protein GXO26_03150 [Crenarchaeota archaeon]|nr:hypothetical protein [Thermoproteota archaeon]